MTLKSRLLRLVTPRVGSLAPKQNSVVVHQVLDRAVRGVGPLPGAVASAERQREAAGGDVRRAVDALVTSHGRLALTQGFLTNVGGLATAAATVPTNLVGLAVVQSHLAAAIAHLGGHDVHDPAVRNAVLACLLGADAVDDLVRQRDLPGGPRTIAATAGTSSGSAALDHKIATELTNTLIARVTGRGLVRTVARRIPLAGGVVGGHADARSTRAVGAYAARELTSLPDRR